MPFPAPNRRSRLIDPFTQDHRVILSALQGHGRTADIDRPLGVRLMADDTTAPDRAPRPGPLVRKVLRHTQVSITADLYGH
jgi:hypothetical protein